LFALACLPIAAVLLDRGPTAATLLTLLAGLVTVAHRKNLVEEFSQLASRRHSQPESEHPPL
jgi:thiamine transporter ThiT